MTELFRQRAFKIIHIDMDCFYAQVETRDHPELRGKPVAIGGPSRTKGILCTSNYEARKYGVKSAQPTFQAFQLCPDLILIPPNFEKYKTASSIVKEIFLSFSDKVQSVSLDEAYLDVTHSQLYGGSASLIATEIQKQIFIETGLTASAGVSFNKMLAKIASDWNKPNGIFTVTPEMQQAFMENLPLRKIPGIGKVSCARYEALGYRVCSDVTKKNIFDLMKTFGKRSALELYRACLGISNSEVKDKTQRKSFGIENTFYTSLTRTEHIEEQLLGLIQKYSARLEKLDSFHLSSREATHIYVKVRFDDFTTYTREKMLSHEKSNTLIKTRAICGDTSNELKSLLFTLCGQYKKPVRLIGIGIKLSDKAQEQLDFGWPTP